MSEITVKSLLEAGVHFGHQTQRWNPKMADFIFGQRSGVHIIDLEQTLGYLHEAQNKVKEITKDGGLVLFVCTKRQGKEAIKAAADRAQMPYVTERWLGGLMTNFETIKTRLALLAKLREEKRSGDWERLPKKEVAKKTEQLARLEMLLGGVAALEKIPAAIFVCDVVREDLAVKEAKNLKLPVIGVVDSNANPKEIDYPIPGNDDAVGAITLIAEAIADAAVDGGGRYRIQAGKDAEAAAAKLAKEEAAKQKEEAKATKEKAKEQETAEAKA